MKLSRKGKKILLVGGSILLLLIFLIFILISNKTDGAKFKLEYESLNNKRIGDYKYQKLKIDKKNKVKYISLDEAIDILENKTGLIYFGFSKCPFCRGAIPSLLETVKGSNLNELYYVDVSEIRDTFEVKEGNIKQIKNADENYYKLLDLLDNYLEDYIVKDEDDIEYSVEEKRLYAPTVVAVQDGIISGVHSGSIEFEENQSPYDALSETQKSELKTIYQSLVDTISVN